VRRFRVRSIQTTCRLRRRVVQTSRAPSQLLLVSLLQRALLALALEFSGS
jgi:hypothetical protein